MARALIALALALASAGTAPAQLQPNDPVWPEQWAQRKIGLPQVWPTTTGDPRIVIATVDTGANPVPDLAGTLVPGWDFVESDTQAQDVDSHGTRVASVIAARGNDGLGMVGHCWDCRVMPIRVTAAQTVSPERIGAGIDYAVAHGARVVNVSLSHPGQPDPIEQAAVKNALDRGVIVVAAAGNAGTDVPQYPAAYPGVLSVGATDETDTLYFWSGRGSWVRLAAPGCQMVETDARTPPGTMCGTSFTPAAVSGLIGLLLSWKPELTPNQVVGALLGTARPVPGTTAGRIDAPAAFRALGLDTPAVPADRPPSGAAAAPAPGQRFTKQRLFETGTFRGGFQESFDVGRGRFELQLLTPAARSCSLSVRTAGEVIVSSPAVKGLLSLSVRVAAGRVAVEVHCRGSRSRWYSLGITAMFPRDRP